MQNWDINHFLHKHEHAFTEWVALLGDYDPFKAFIPRMKLSIKNELEG